MTFERAKIRQLRPYVYLIDDAGESTCYLVTGQERALLIDTSTGLEDLHAVVRSLTELPVTVVNTHGHYDHIFGNVFFEEAWMHPADLPVAALEAEGRPLCPFRPLQIGQSFDLGGVQLEIVDLRGHTPGSVGLLDKTARLLYSGDGIIPKVWMQFDYSLTIRELHDALTTLKTVHGGDFDLILTGHAQDYLPANLLDEMIDGCRELLAGQTARDLPYTYFGGECLQHPLRGWPENCIVYAADKL